MENGGPRAAGPDRLSARSDSAVRQRQQELANKLRGQAAAWARPEEVDALVGEIVAAVGKRPQRRQPPADQPPPSEEPASEETTPETWRVTDW